jgi:hypothetical protein
LFKYKENNFQILTAAGICFAIIFLSSDITDMTTKKDFTARILAITTKIKQEHPELYPYLEEMAITLPDEKNPDVDTDALKEYYELLVVLLDKYNISHEHA